MTSSVNSGRVAAPPEDRVRTALHDPAECERLRRQARVLVRDRGIDVDDTLQTVKLRAIEKSGTFACDGRPVGAWLHGILMNVVREQVRAKIRHPMQQPDDRALWEQWALEPDGRARSLAEAGSLVERLLDRLSPADQAVVRLRFFDGLDLQAVACHLGIGYHAARARFCRAMQRLQASAAAVPAEDRP